MPVPTPRSRHRHGGASRPAAAKSTPLFANFDSSGKLAPALERAIPMRRLGQPEDYPGLVAFLLSDEASFITGQTISVSGGLTMQG